MSEKRKPLIKIIAEIPGKIGPNPKRLRIELFETSLWPKLFPYSRDKGRFRVRVDGKWANGHTSYTVSEVMSQLRSWIARKRKAKF